MSNNLWDPKKFEMFSDSKLAILRKIREHPPLQTLLLQYDAKEEWPEMLGEIAAYCGVGVNGVYSPPDLSKLEDLLYRKLSEATMVLATTPIIGEDKGRGRIH